MAAYAHDPAFADSAYTADMTRVHDGCWTKRMTAKMTDKPHQVVVVPNDAALRHDIIDMHHAAITAGHPGATRTLELVQRFYWWPSMRGDIHTHVSKCPHCQRNKPASGKQPGRLKPLPTPSKPWDSVGMDFIVALPPTKSKFNAIAVFVDRLTKMVHLCPCTNKVTAQDTASLFINAVVKLHGVPSDTVSDRGPQFAGSFWQSLAERLGITVNLSTAYHPQTDGQTERAGL